jgi:hypothetical protein
MRYLVLCFLTIFLLSCKNEHTDHSNFKKIIFKNSSFKHIFETSVKELKSTMIEEDKSTIIEFYIDPYYDYDTIVAIRNCPPVNVKNLILVKTYQKNNVYIYCAEDLQKRLNQFIDTDDDTIDYVSLKPVTSDFECIYSRLFKLNDNRFTAIKRD